MTDLSLAGLEFGLGRWLAAVALGAMAGLDATSFPQVMVSRPIIAATVAGALFGKPEAGFLVGLALELLVLRHAPFGAARYPDPGPAGVVAGIAYAGAGSAALGPFLVALIAGWATSWLGTRSIHWLRHLNGRLVGEPAAIAASASRLERRHRLAVRLDAARAALVTAAMVFPALAGARLAASVQPVAWAESIAPLLVLAGIGAAAGAAGRSLGAERRSWPLIVLGVGAAFLWL